MQSSPNIHLIRSPQPSQSGWQLLTKVFRASPSEAHPHQHQETSHAGSLLVPWQWNAFRNFERKGQRQGQIRLLKSWTHHQLLRENTVVHQTHGILSTEITMADRNLSVTVLMFLIETSRRFLTSSWLRACSGVTSYGSLLFEKVKHMKASIPQSSIRQEFLAQRGNKLIFTWLPRAVHRLQSTF